MYLSYSNFPYFCKANETCSIKFGFRSQSKACVYWSFGGLKKEELISLYNTIYYVYYRSCAAHSFAG